MDGTDGKKENQNSVGPAMSIAVLVLVFAAGGLYFLYQENKRFHTPPVEEVFGATSTPAAQ